jgi:hypothetical protein
MIIFITAFFFFLIGNLIKRDIHCGLLNIENWKNCKNSRINKANLNEEHFNELIKIENLLKEHIKSLGYEHRVGDWFNVSFDIVI